jgi:hypothetical protein
MRWLKLVLGYSLAAAVVFGGFMLAGTLLLGHVRPMWMELDYVPASAGLGLLVGALVGLVAGSARTRPRFLIVALLAVPALAAGVTFLPLTNGPVLLHVFGQGDCACGDYHEKATGIVIWNRYRERLPEKVAHTFLVDLRAGRCSAEPAVCDYAVNRHRVSDWRLVNRHDAGDSVVLYFKLTKYGTADAAYDLTGEGVIELRRNGTAWAVRNYSAYF